MESVINSFSESLRGLFDEAKILSRRGWATLLGVSESAISQWVTGSSKPQPRHFEVIVKKSKEKKLDNYTRKLLDNLMCSLEVDDAQSRDAKISDYMIKNKKENFQICFDSLFYELKVELLHQYVREIEIIRTDLEKKLFNITNDDDIEKRIEAFNGVNESFKMIQHRAFFETYVQALTKAHANYNENLTALLDSNDDKEFSQQSSTDTHIKVINIEGSSGFMSFMSDSNKHNKLAKSHVHGIVPSFHNISMIAQGSYNVKEIESPISIELRDKYRVTYAADNNLEIVKLYWPEKNNAFSRYLGGKTYLVTKIRKILNESLQMNTYYSDPNSCWICAAQSPRTEKLLYCFGSGVSIARKNKIQDVSFKDLNLIWRARNYEMDRLLLDLTLLALPMKINF